MHGYRNSLRTTEPTTFRLTPEEKQQLLNLTRNVKREGDYCLSDIVRTAYLRGLRSLRAQMRKRNHGRLWLCEQIKIEKGVQAQSEKSQGSPVKVSVEDISE